jgi:multidrug efflux pump subunit AcrB
MVIVWGLGFSLFVSLLLVPMIYRILGRRRAEQAVVDATAGVSRR